MIRGDFVVKQEIRVSKERVRLLRDKAAINVFFQCRLSTDMAGGSHVPRHPKDWLASYMG